MSDKLRFQIVAKGLPWADRKTVEITGRPIDKATFTAADAEKVIETEQFLERITGVRFHINQV